MIIVDGSNLLSKTKYVNEKIEGFEVTWEFMATKFLEMTLSYMKKKKDSDIVICWDKNGSSLRKSIYPEHKKKNPIDTNTPEGKVKLDALIQYGIARTWLHDNIHRIGIKSILIPGIEADDIAYTLINCCTSLSGKTGIMLTEDKDWKQSLKLGWSIFRPIQHQVITYESFRESMKLNGEELSTPRKVFIWQKALLGKKREIPGVVGIGEKTSLPIIKKLFANRDLNPNSKREKAVIDAINSGEFTKYLELADYSLLPREQVKQICSAYEVSRVAENNKSDILVWLSLAEELKSQKVLDFDKYFNFGM